MTNQSFQRSVPDLLSSAPGSRLVLRNVLIVAIAAVLLALSACAAGTGGASAATPTAAQANPTAQAASPTPGGTNGYPIKVYFSRFPDSIGTDFTAVFPVNRVSPSTSVATFAIQLLIAGPTLDERSQGYFSELNSALTGASACNGSYPTGGPDFTITLNKKGSTTEQDTATLKFCRTTQLAGEGTGTRIMAEIVATLTQFSNIKKVVILTRSGHCFNDESGMDLCLQ